MGAVEFEKWRNPPCWLFEKPNLFDDCCVVPLQRVPIRESVVVPAAGSSPVCITKANQ